MVTRHELPDHVPVALYRTTPAGRFLDVNRELVEMLGYPGREALLGTSVVDVWVDPEERSRFLERLDREGFVRGFEMRILRADGTEIWARNTARRDRDRDGTVTFEGAIEDISDRKRAEASLRESQERYRSLVEMSPLPIAVHSRGVLRYVNPAAARLVGAGAPADLIGRQVLDFVDPAFRRRVMDRIRASYEGRQPNALTEERFLTLDGRAIDVEVASQPIDFEGEPATQVVIRDVSAHKQAESRLRESEARLRLVIDAAPVLLWATDRDGRVTFAAGRALAHIGLDPEEVVGQSIFELYRSHPEVRANIHRAISGEEFNATVIVDGLVFEVRYAPLLAPDGAGVGMIGVSIDVSEERRLEEEERKLAAIVERSSDFIGVAAPDHRILYVNKAGRALVGLRTLAEARSKTVRDFFVEADRAKVEQRVIPALARGESLEFEASLHHLVTGEPILTDFKAFLIRHWSTGEPLALATIARDIRERRQAEEELRKAHDTALEASRLKSSFLANMSHEIRTPLNVILGYNEIIAEHVKGRGDHSQDELFAAVERAGERLMGTVHSVLDISRIEVGAFELARVPVELAPLVERLVRDAGVLARQKQLAMDCEITERDAVVWFDEYCITNAVTNLLGNAIKFTERGSVRVTLARDAGGELVLAVEDTGVGIDPYFLGHVFEPFSQEHMDLTRRFEGAGLGLTLTQRYVELNGARISVDSRKGHGTTFRIRFPKALETSPPAAKVSAGLE